MRAVPHSNGAMLTVRLQNGTEVSDLITDGANLQKEFQHLFQVASKTVKYPGAILATAMQDALSGLQCGSAEWMFVYTFMRDACDHATGAYPLLAEIRSKANWDE